MRNHFWGLQSMAMNGPMSAFNASLWSFGRCQPKAGQQHSHTSSDCTGRNGAKFENEFTHSIEFKCAIKESRTTVSARLHSKNTNVGSGSGAAALVSFSGIFFVCPILFSGRRRSSISGPRRRVSGPRCKLLPTAAAAKLGRRSLLAPNTGPNSSRWRRIRQKKIIGFNLMRYDASYNFFEN